MTPLSWTLFAVLLSLLIWWRSWMKKKYNYWKEKGVAHPEVVPIFGNLLPVATLSKTQSDLYASAYNDFPKEKIVGLYEMVEPVLVLRDPEIMEKILVKDFQHFVDHPEFTTDDNIFSNGLFNLKGKLWRSVRYKISPTFTTGKLKAMFNQMLECSDSLVGKLKGEKETNLKNTLKDYSLNVVASTVFGIEMKDKRSKEDFFDMTNKLFYSGIINYFKLLIVGLFPSICKKLGVEIFTKEVQNYFNTLLETTFKQRKESKLQRNDYLDNLIKLSEKGTIEAIEKDTDDNYLSLGESNEIETIEFDDKLLKGQALQFLLAGFDPVVNSTVYAFFELAKCPNVQEKARKEVKDMIRKHGGFSYASLKDMVYLDQCIKESMRFHNIVEFLMRRCTKEYTTSDGLVIEKGMRVLIPLNALNMDPQYFPDPEKFYPERFDSDENVPFVYLPFGTGPRMCIGMRFALIEVKIALAKVLNNYKFSLNSNTVLPLQFNRKSFIPILISDILINFEPLE